MTITNQDVDIWRGDSALLEISLTDSNGDPYQPQGGDQVIYRVAPNSHAPDSKCLVIKDLSNGIIVTNGIVAVSLTPDDTDLKPGSYYHELKVYAGIDVATAMVGNFEIHHALRTAISRQAGARFSIIGRIGGA